MKAHTFSEMIEDLLDDLPEDAVLNGKVARTRSYEAGGVLTANAGITVQMANGDEFQITVVQSKRGEPEDDEEEER